jgi:hypothetical protein
MNPFNDGQLANEIPRLHRAQGKRRIGRKRKD